MQQLVSKNSKIYQCQNLTVSSETGSKKKRSLKIWPPSNSIAAGLDFRFAGRLGLATPSLVELKILAKHRYFHNVVKVQGNHSAGSKYDYTSCHLRASNIVFRHNNPVVASIAMMHKMKSGSSMGLKEIFNQCITIELVGPVEILLYRSYLNRK